MSETSRLRTDLRERRFLKIEIEAEAAKKIKSLKDLLAGANIRSLSEIDFHLIADIAADLKILREQWDRAVEDIVKILKELE